jgi:phospholipase/carboxylesterase
VPPELPALPGTPVLLANARMDPLVPVAATDRLAALLGRAGAEVTVAWQAGGHDLTDTDVEIAREWIRRHALRIAPRPSQDAPP